MASDISRDKTVFFFFFRADRMLTSLWLCLSFRIYAISFGLLVVLCLASIVFFFFFLLCFRIHFYTGHYQWKWENGRYGNVTYIQVRPSSHTHTQCVEYNFIFAFCGFSVRFDFIKYYSLDLIEVGTHHTPISRKEWHKASEWRSGWDRRLSGTERVSESKRASERDWGGGGETEPACIILIIYISATARSDNTHIVIQSSLSIHS